MEKKQPLLIEVLRSRILERGWQDPEQLFIETMEQASAEAKAEAAFQILREQFAKAKVKCVDNEFIIRLPDLNLIASAPGFYEALEEMVELGVAFIEQRSGLTIPLESAKLVGVNVELNQ